MRLLALTHPGTCSRGLLEDTLDGYQRLGHEIIRFELEPYWAIRQSLGESYKTVAMQLGRVVMNLIERNGIDASVAMWCNATLSLPIVSHPDGSLASLMDHHGHVHIHHWWDAPHWHNNQGIHDEIVRGLFRGGWQAHLINNAATGGEMAALMGFRNVMPTPNAVNPRTFRPCPEIKTDFDLVFISGPGDPPPTPVMLEELEKPDPDVERIRRDVAGRLGPELEQLSIRFPEPLRPLMRRLFDAMVEQRLADRHTPAAVHLQRAVQLDATLTAAAKALTGDIRAYIAATKTVRQIETWERPFLVAYLSRHFKCLRMGLQDYSPWGVQAHSIQMVPYERQREAYARAAFALNVMRWQDDVGLNSKVFEITASGVGCLQAWRGGIDELFEAGREMLVFRTPGEAKELLAEALARPSRREDITQAGRDRTLRDHTWEKRLGPVMQRIAGGLANLRNTQAKPSPSQPPAPTPVMAGAAA
jgi:spore maturation protein CgeB